MTSPLVRSAVAHLLRRTAFGATADEIDALAEVGYDGAVERLFVDLREHDDRASALPPPEFATDEVLDAGDDPAARREAARITRTARRQLVAWWILRMVVADRPVREWLTLSWHNHFATSMAKVKLPELMHLQYTTLYDAGPGRFDDLVGAVARDPAMLIWLDGRLSTATAPNENFARELFELFTLGHGTHASDQPYGEHDVAEAARALTGWVIDRQRRAGVLMRRRFDDGTKAVLGVTGNLGLDDVVRIATDHPACARHVVARLWSRLARPVAPDDPVEAELAPGFAADLDVSALLRRMLLHPEFLAPASRTGLLKTPVQYLVGTARALGVHPDGPMIRSLARLGQIPFLPPDVGGWPANAGWISTATAQERLAIARPPGRRCRAGRGGARRRAARRSSGGLGTTARCRRVGISDDSGPRRSGRFRHGVDARHCRPRTPTRMTETTMTPTSITIPHQVPPTPPGVEADPPGRLSRRHFLVGAGALGVTAAFGTLPVLAATLGPCRPPVAPTRARW